MGTGYRTSFVLILLILTASQLSSCREKTDSSGQDANEVTRTGRLAVIRNGHDIFILFDQNGTKYELLIDDTLLQLDGGALAIDCKTITVRGVWTTDAPPKLMLTAVEQIQP